ncbi:hypothetical protein A33M_0832 [Rhodovulum sp. PH10]|nr:hypothetical protein A33M_0832 [Rhodovulum sp. PH10]
MAAERVTPFARLSHPDRDGGNPPRGRIPRRFLSGASPNHRRPRSLPSRPSHFEETT